MKYSKELKTIRVSQKNVSFFITKMTPLLLNTIINKNISVYKDPIDGIQRDKNLHKIEEIKRYLSDDKLATFPNTIIIAIRDDLDTEAPLFVIDEDDKLSIALESDIANIIDGQHRLAGFEENDDIFELPVAVFLNLPLGEQAKLFAKINSTQTKVNLDVVYENFFKSEERSREKTSFYIVKSLNEKVDSPWYGKIKTLSDRGGDLAQGSMAKYIDKNLLSYNKPLSGLYESERDQEIFDVLFNFFKAVQMSFPEQWNNSSGEFILTKTTGFVGFMNFLSDIFKIRGVRRYQVEDFIKLIGIIKGNFSELTNDNYPSGAIGQNKIRDILRSGFTPEEKAILGIK